jgi:hypothetical protein
MISRTFVFWGSVLLFSAGMSVGHAQDNSATTLRSQSDSLGDAARKARAQKKHSGKAAKVFTNDDMRGPKDTFSERAKGKKPAGAVLSGPDRGAEATIQPR